MRKPTLFLKRTILPVSLSFWLMFFFTSAAVFAQSENTSVLAEQGNVKNLSLHSSATDYYTTFDEDDCGQETPSNDVENGLGNLNELQFANDFTVNPEENFSLDSISFNFLTEYGETINSADFYFYEDSGNGPGAEIISMTAVTPATNESIGEAFDFDLRKVTFEFEEINSFIGTSSESVYWVGIKLNYTGINSYIEVTTILNTPNSIYYLDNDTDLWVESANDPDFNMAYDGVLSIYGECIELDGCTGEPDAGYITGGETMEVCKNIGFGLSVSDATQAAGLSYQWQEKQPEEEDWTDIDGAQESSLQVDDGITEEKDYRLRVNCDNSEEFDYTDAITVTLKPVSECYCTPNYSTGCSSGDRISNVTLVGESETIDNDSQCSPDSFGDFTDHTPADLAPGETYILSVSTDYNSPGFEDVRAWIDFNANGIFDEEEEIANTEGNGLALGGTSEFEFAVPEQVEPGTYRMRVKLDYSNSEIQPCTGSTWGETEDYMVEIIELDECQDPVTAGNVVDTDLDVCTDFAFSIAVTGASDPANGLNRQWQSSPVGEEDWTDIEGAHASTYIVSEGIDEPTLFRYKVACNDGDPDYSETIEVNLNPVIECYCIPEGTNSSYYIDNFSTSGGVENIENLNSGFSEDGYGDFTETHIVSQAHTLSVDFEGEYEGGTYGTKIWVDWNQDGVFDEDEIAYQSSSYSGSQSGSFDVPESATLGETRMRIGIAWSPNTGPNSPCEIGSYEFEDYTFEVLALEDCEGMPTAGTPVEDEITICAGTPFDLSVSDATGAANNLYRRWQSSPAGEDDWTDMDGANSATYTVVEGVDEPTDFRYILTCNEENTDISDVIEVTLKPALECYCTPENTSSTSDYISNVTTENALQNIDHTTEFAENGYGDYSDSEIITVYPGQEFDYSITGTSSFQMHYGIWLDMDQSGDFEEPLEKIADSNGTMNPPFTGSFEVPADMAEGSYRMRVRAAWLNGDIGACEDNPYGETEDYTLQVIIPDCFPPLDIEIDYITDFSAQVSWDANEGDSWELIYGEEGFDPEEEGTTIQVTDLPTADLIDLDEDTTYEVYVKTVCENDESVWTGPITFTTNITPPENTRLCDAIPLEANSGCIGGPYTNIAAFEETNEPIGSCHNNYRGENTVWFTFVASGDGEAVITTDFNSTEIQTEIVVFEAPTDCEDMTTLGEEVGCASASDEGLLELEGLTPGETYYVKVAGFNNTEGDFCIEVQLEDVPTCFAPTEIEIGDISDETVEISWTAGGEETQWEVTYGEAGFNPETEGDSEIVNTTEVTLIDLSPETDYEVYVRAICTNLNSDLAGPETFTTDPMSVDSHIFADFTFYPNPVKDQLTLKAGSQIETVEVYNLLGQNVISAQPNSLETQINTENLQSGVYLMNITIDGSQKTFRVVKQ